MCARNIYTALKQKIKMLHLPPGDPIVIGQLSEALGVSHIPIREALGRLAAEGQIDYAPGRGYFMRRVDTKSLIECFTCLELNLLYAIDQLQKTEVKGRHIEIVAELCRLADGIDGTKDEFTMAAICERMLFILLQSLENRYLARAAESAADQIYFLLPAAFAHPIHRERLCAALHRVPLLLCKGKAACAKVIVTNIFRDACCQAHGQIADALHLASLPSSSQYSQNIF
jgi:DNA-binding GntR family transcriptional regulator